MRALVAAMLLAGVTVLSGCGRTDGCTDRNLACGSGPSTLALVTARGG
ncbi:hypothetical protein [Variovorax sp. YR216]|nr:hypothetical protein [Variovorax sp. YR216]SEA16081.1 hypothetical protein SAMN05444680_101728 [Variovorax sp. YR216]